MERLVNPSCKNNGNSSMKNSNKTNSDFSWSDGVNNDFDWHDESQELVALGLLKDALETIKHNPYSKVSSEMKRWIMSDDETIPLSFLDCCERLGFNSDNFRLLLSAYLNNPKGDSNEQK